jgi:hypothetical protein
LFYPDKDGDWLDGARSYRLRVPPNAPVEQFWSLTIYDVSTRTLIANKEQIADRSSRMDLVKSTSRCGRCRRAWAHERGLHEHRMHQSWRMDLVGETASAGGRAKNQCYSPQCLTNSCSLFR